MKAIFQRGADDRREHFIRSRFIRSLKEKSWEPMDGGLICPPSLFRSRWLKSSWNDWERLGTVEVRGAVNTPQ